MKEQIIAIIGKHIKCTDEWGSLTGFSECADEIMQMAEFEELCKPDYAEMHMNDSVMRQNIDAALAEIQGELAEEKKSNKLLHEAMITAEKRGYDKALAESRAKMPSEGEIIEKINKLYSTWKNPDTDEKMNHNDNMERYRMGFTACVKWFRNRMEESK